jgi:putative endonuclease
LELLGFEPAPYYNPGVHFVYIVRCADGTLYTGYARDPRARVRVHNTGRGARYTAGRRPVTLVYAESFESVGDALRREHALKRRSRAEKEALIRRRRAHPATRTFPRAIQRPSRPDADRALRAEPPVR